MITERIRVGDAITTIAGEIRVTAWNGSIACCEEYETDPDQEKLIYVGARNLTPHEIGKLMKEIDGQNHKVLFYKAEEEI